MNGSISSRKLVLTDFGDERGPSTRAALGRSLLHRTLARSHRFDHRVRIGPSPAEKAIDEATRARRDEVVVDQDVELTRRPHLELGVDSGLFLQLGSETRCPIAIASGLTVENLDAHEIGVSGG